jgi:type III secretory pathway component EscS
MKNLIQKLRTTDWEIFNRYIMLLIISVAPVVVIAFIIGMLLDIVTKC